MNKLVFAVIIISVFAINMQRGNAQCKDFAQNQGIEIMDTTKYIHDGKFNAIKLRQGDEIRLFKPFFSGEKYRVVVCGSDELGDIEFEVLDFKGKKTIFTNKEDNIKHWDFESSTSQRLIISVNVPLPPGGDTEAKKKGCVAILFGLKKE